MRKPMRFVYTFLLPSKRVGVQGAAGLFCGCWYNLFPLGVRTTSLCCEPPPLALVWLLSSWANEAWLSGGRNLLGLSSGGTSGE